MRAGAVRAAEVAAHGVNRVTVPAERDEAALAALEEEVRAFKAAHGFIEGQARVAAEAVEVSVAAVQSPFRLRLPRQLPPRTQAEHNGAFGLRSLAQHIQQSRCVRTGHQRPGLLVPEARNIIVHDDVGAIGLRRAERGDGGAFAGEVAVLFVENGEDVRAGIATTVFGFLAGGHDHRGRREDFQGEDRTRPAEGGNEDFHGQ